MDSPRHRRENAFLRAAARLAPDLAALAPASALDWPYLLRAADQQGITPLLHAALQSAGVPALAAVLAGLHAAYWQNHFRNRALMAELARILGAAATARVDAMPLKGAVLAPL
ncbi:MAG: nucleotidyltransferase family protein, partial [Thermomicrobiales bacterium]